MSQGARMKSPQSPQPELKSELKAVLGCLDVQLEPELTRYRRHRRRTKQTTPDSTGQTTPQFQQTPDAVAVAVNEGAASQGKLFEPQAQPSGWETVVPSQPAPLVVSNSATTTNDPKTNGKDPAVSFNLKSSAPVAAPSDGYLESTEALIKSIEERRSQSPEKRSLMASLLTPMGIASMFLFLLSCTALSYVLSSPSSRTSLGLNRFFPTPTPTANPSPTTPPTTASTDTSLPATDSLSPNLAAKEFVNLDLDTLSNINPNPNTLPTPAVAPPVPPSPATTLPAPSNNLTSPTDPGLNNLTQELLPKKPTTSTVPTPTTTAPAPVTGQGRSAATVQPGGGTAPKVATASTPPKPTEPIKSQDGYYYVVLDYVDERSFEQAKEVIPDAYIAEFKTGKKIQVAALTDAASAKRLRDELKVQGINAYYDIPKP
ncbi:hypothetical protein PCC9214_01938 [Planktothrix tepida]|uniref:SPOR domain-containing protein n=1 Tax=Planktothrix tepida PCC 9214 TaxID=671072 RepID=A0A1J1LKS0_9CYAN|nr:hypothetical protein [Planktothrix tepida]CAD5941202.1 hypothetical protein PCC9214_01938 [Planktothrix tepida]CUR33104.1 conserved hypothetical protein [Planktothrix tepida PCC 9214]